MSEVTQHEAGTPSWADLGTTDAEAAVGFYSALFGWEAENTPAGPAGTYVLCRREGKDVVGLYEQNEAMRSRGVPPIWLIYISVDDIAAATRAVEEAGGTVHAQPFDLAEAGRMSLVQDPTGAMFGLWEAKNRPGAQVLHEPGAMDWFELATNDAEKAGEFYEKVLGWEVKTEDFGGTEYTTCWSGESAVAGILPAASLPEDVPPNWSVYFAVEDCAAAVEQATSSGGELVFGPQDMPSVGQFAGLRDPQGAAFAVIQPAPTEEQAQAEQSEGGSDSDQSDSDQKDSDQKDSQQGDDSEQQSAQQSEAKSEKSEHDSGDDSGDGSDRERESKKSGEDSDSDDSRVGLSDSPDSEGGAEPV